MTPHLPRTAASCLTAVILAIGVAAVPSGVARAAVDTHADAVPTYEVKLDLGPTALTSAHQPTAAVLSAFGLSAPTTRSYEYLDTDALDLNAQGWDVRLRHKSGKDLELSYKKRFAVSGGNVDGALDDANAAGFDSSDTNYDAEVDWGYSKQTLSFSDEKSESAKGLSGTSLPADDDAVDLATDEVPGKLEDWSGKNWGEDHLADSRAHGPVTSTVWSGTWEGQDASIEVVPVRSSTGSGTEWITELSFKVDDHDTAAAVRGDAISTTDAHGWLLHSDVLKTQLILDRY